MREIIEQGIRGGPGLVLVLSLLFVGCDEQQAALPPKERPPVPVRVAPIEKRLVQETVTLVGTVEPWRRSLVASEIEGLVEDFLVEEGSAVISGQVLARLRTDTLKIQLHSTLAAYREAVTRHRQAQKDLARIRALFRKELVTQKEFDDAVTQEMALRQRVAQLRTEIQRVRDDIDKSRIAAPFDGLVTKEFTEVGQWVAEGGAVVELVDLSRVKVEVPLPERYIGTVKIGDTVRARFDGLPGVHVTGRIVAVVAQADPAARTFPIKVVLPNRDLRIKSGMVSRVTLFVGEPHEALVVPKDALVLRSGQEFVFIIRGDRVSQVPVAPGLHLDGVVEVTGDLAPEALVVVEGNERLLPGQAVRILDEMPSDQVPS